MRSIFEDNQSGGHIIAADSWHSVSSNEKLEQIFYDLFGRAFGLQSLFYDIYDSLAILHIILPNAVAAQQNELIRLFTLKLFHVRLASYHLLVVAQALVSFVVEVT